MLGEMDPLKYDIYFYENEWDAMMAGQLAMDAPDFSNAIADPTTYESIIPFEQQTLYVLAVGNETNTSPFNGGEGCFDIVPLEPFVDSSPVTVEPSPFKACDASSSGNGFAFFNVAEKDLEIADGDLDASIKYYETLTQAMDGIENTELQSPYQNTIPFSQTIYARVNKDFADCFSVVSLDLIVQELPTIAVPMDLSQLDDDGDNFAIFDLTINDAIVLGELDPEDYQVSYFETELDAQSDSYPITNPMSYQNIQNPQTIYVRVENLNTACFVIASFTLSVETLSVNSHEFENLPLLPNPTSGSVSIQSSQLVSETSILVYDLLGKTLISKRISPQNGAITVDVSSFVDGVYFVKISSGGKVAVRKLIKVGR